MKNPDFSNLKNQINEHLVNVLTFICQNPLIFVSETDIHQLVMRELMKINELNPEKDLFETSCTIGSNKKGTQSPTKYKTMLIHKEYGHANLPWSRSDIVILNPSDIKKIDDPINLSTKVNWLQPDYIFEFGSEKATSSASSFEKHLYNDLKKVNEAAKQGFLIHLHRNYILSSGGKKEKNTLKYNKFPKALEKVITSFPGNNNLPNKKLPKIIVIIINIGNERRVIKKEGKIKLIKNPYDPNCKFTSINNKSIRNELESLIY